MSSSKAATNTFVLGFIGLAVLCVRHTDGASPVAQARADATLQPRVTNSHLHGSRVANVHLLTGVVTLASQVDRELRDGLTVAVQSASDSRTLPVRYNAQAVNRLIEERPASVGSRKSVIEITDTKLVPAVQSLVTGEASAVSDVVRRSSVDALGGVGIGEGLASISRSLAEFPPAEGIRAGVSLERAATLPTSPIGFSSEATRAATP